MAINTHKAGFCKALRGAVAAREFGEKQTKEFHMNDTHAEMALDYGIDVTVAAAEFMKFDVMGSALLYMELQTEARDSRDNRT